MPSVVLEVEVTTEEMARTSAFLARPARR